MTQAALEKVALVSVDLSTWSGYKRTSEDELERIGVKLPKNSPLTKGGKKIYPTEYLKEFTNIRKEIERTLRKVGVRALGGGNTHAVPESKVDEINEFLEAVKLRTDLAIDDFKQNYDVRVADYLNSIDEPIIKNIISSALIPCSEASKKFGIAWQVFKIIPAGDPEEGSKSLVSGLTNSLLEEVAERAQVIWEKSFLGKPKVTQKAIHQVKDLRNKMAGLSFLDPDTINAVVKSMDDTFASLPSTGWIQGDDLNILHSVVIRMGQPESLLQHARLVAEGMSTQDAINKSIEATIGMSVPPKDVQADVGGANVAVETQTPVVVEDIGNSLFSDEHQVNVSAVAAVDIEEPSAFETVSAESIDGADPVQADEVIQTAEPVNVVVEVVEAELLEAEPKGDVDDDAEETTVVPLHEVEVVKPTSRRGAAFF